MVAALHNSRLNGKKPNCFKHGKNATPFSWKTIEDMLARELNRIQKSQACRVPGLKESFVYRDSWTRLNVKCRFIATHV